MPLPPCYDVLEQGRGTLAPAWNRLQSAFAQLLPTDDTGLRIDIAWENGVTARLVNDRYDYASREFGGDVPVVEIVRGDARRQPFWLNWTEIWREGRGRKLAYHTTGLTVFVGERHSRQKLQLFRAEWPGVRSILDDEPQYEAQGAGHPHWQFDALRSFVAQRQQETERERLAAFIDEIVQVEEFEELAEAQRQPDVAIPPADLSWTRMHFATLADWATHPWDGNSLSIRQHARGPSNVPEIHNWVLSCVRYIRRELQR